MKTRVGIPRAMGFYYLYPFYRTLLQELGAEPVLSPPTTRGVLARMESCPTDEPCLAVKMHFAHADTLAARKDIDVLFLPILARVDNSFCCPKFIGIADMIRHGLRLADERVLMPTIDYSANDDEMLQALLPLANRLGIAEREPILQAIRRGREAQQRYRQLCVTNGITTPEAYHMLETGELPGIPAPPPGSPTVAVIGHPYLIYEVVSQGMIERLRSAARVVTAEMVPQEGINAAMDGVHEGERMWPFEAMLLGAALQLLQTRAVDKMILVGSFECGPESIIEAYIEEEAERQGIPLMVLSLDEHSGEAGLVTRLEAFMDTEKAPGIPAAPLPTPHVVGKEELVVAIPSMGHVQTVVRAVLHDFGVQTVPTPPTSKMTIELGREIAPEFACFPFTATLGQMRAMLDQGANAVLMVGGKGYCRLGWYAQVQEKLLRNLGHDFELFIIDSPFPLRAKWAPFRDTLKRLTHQASWPRILGRLYTAYHHMAAMDRAECVAHRLRAIEREQGTMNRVLDRYLRRLAGISELGSIRRLEREFREEVAAIETEDTHPLRVRITGEIWVVLEQAATREVERWLGARTHPRVWVERDLSSTEWFDSHILHMRAAKRREAQVLSAARPWLSKKVGGHGQITVGTTALAPQEGFDGVLHILPFTCMPEIIAQNIMVRMSEEMDLPILTYIVSEQTGEAGMETRLESFIDLLEERRYAERTPASLVALA